MSLIKLLTIVSTPIALVKSIISGIHLAAASINLTSLDAQQRNAAKSN